MIAVIIYRPDLDPDNEGKLEGVELLGIYPNSLEDSVNDMVNALADAHPDWRFNVDPGVELMQPEDTLIIMANGGG